jgi:hypothetical protein
MKSRTIGVALLVAASLILIACKPSSTLPLTGELTLSIVSSTESEMRFRLANQTTRAISFRGETSQLADPFPWDTAVDCWDAKTGIWMESGRGFSHGEYEVIEVPAGEQVFVSLERESARESAGAVKGSRCRAFLFLDGEPRVTVKSDEFAF